MNEAIYHLHAEFEESHWWFRARRRIITDLVRSLLPGEGTVVDVGCGTGWVLGGLAADYRCVGVDTSAAAIEIARSRWPGISFWQESVPLDLQRIGRGPRVFLLLDVLEHVENDTGLFSATLETMGDGDHLVLTVPADMDLWSQHDESYGHFRRYDRERLASVWRDHQVEVEVRLLEALNTRLYPVAWILRRLPWRGLSWGKEGTDLRSCPDTLNRLLEWIFAGESRRIRWALENGGQHRGRGVSLVAVLRKGADHRGS